MRIFRLLRKCSEMVLLGLASVLLPLLPRRTIVTLAAVLGNVTYFFSGKLRRVANANLECAFGSTLKEKEREEIARASFRNFALVLLDVFWFSCFTEKRLSRWVSFDPQFRHYTHTAPVIAVTCHFGNWEVMGLTAAFRGCPPMSVAVPLDNRVADSWLVRQRTRTGQMIVASDGALMALFKHLRRGGRVALLLDQNTLPRDGGIFVRFFGKEVLMSRAAAALSRRTGAPITMTFCVPRQNGKYLTWATEPWKVEKEDASEETACRRIAQEMENVIRSYPSMWLWSYKRWKYIPDGLENSGYPFYARHLDPSERAR